MSTATRHLTALMFVLLLSCAPAWAGPDVHRLVFFGDSLSDPGNFYLAFGQVSAVPFAPIPDAPYDIGPGHHYSDGRTWASSWQSSWTPLSAAARRWPGPGVHQLRGGTGAARANAPAFSAYDLSSQVALFLTDFRGHARADAIYVIWIGANDLDDALQALAIDPTGATSATIAQTAIETVAVNIQALYAAGARTFLVPDLPDLGETPASPTLETTFDPHFIEIIHTIRNEIAQIRNEATATAARKLKVA